MPKLSAAGALPCASDQAESHMFAYNFSSDYQILPMVFLTRHDSETVFQNAS
jgi:hypothetical protein